MINVFAHDSYPEGVVHGLVKEVAEKLNDIRMMLRLEQLDSFLLHHNQC
jgi:hypothetical protein